MIKHLKKKISTLRRKKKFKQFYGNYINEGDLCFDIGANIGNRTEIFLNLKARVVSVEPVKKTYLILKEKFGNEKNSTLLQLGIGSEAGIFIFQRLVKSAPLVNYSLKNTKAKKSSIFNGTL